MLSKCSSRTVHVHSPQWQGRWNPLLCSRSPHPFLFLHSLWNPKHSPRRWLCLCYHHQFHHHVLSLPWTIFPAIYDQYISCQKAKAVYLKPDLGIMAIFFSNHIVLHGRHNGYMRGHASSLPFYPHDRLGVKSWHTSSSKQIVVCCSWQNIPLSSAPHTNFPSCWCSSHSLFDESCSFIDFGPSSALPSSFALLIPMLRLTPPFLLLVPLLLLSLVVSTSWCWSNFDCSAFFSINDRLVLLSSVVIFCHPSGHWPNSTEIHSMYIYVPSYSCDFSDVGPSWAYSLIIFAVSSP